MNSFHQNLPPGCSVNDIPGNEPKRRKGKSKLIAKDGKITCFNPCADELRDENARFRKALEIIAKQNISAMCDCEGNTHGNTLEVILARKALQPSKGT